MAILPILQAPHKILKTKVRQVSEITDEDRKLVRDMIETMHSEKGVGLAANQVGVLKALFVASPDQVRGAEQVYFNPKIIKAKGTVKEFEGCLSVPEFYEPVKRAKKVRIRALDLEGREIEVEAEGLLSRIFQHEIDHLNGILFIERLGFIKSRKAVKKLLSRIL